MQQCLIHLKYFVLIASLMHVFKICIKMMKITYNCLQTLTLIILHRKAQVCQGQFVNVFKKYITLTNYITSLHCVSMTLIWNGQLPSTFVIFGQFSSLYLQLQNNCDIYIYIYIQALCFNNEYLSVQENTPLPMNSTNRILRLNFWDHLHH